MRRGRDDRALPSDGLRRGDPRGRARATAWCSSTPTPRCRPAASRRRCARSAAACCAVDEVMSGKARNAFVATRPPGHHAETARPMGFCLFNSAAIAARYAQKKHGAERVAIVDFDVHHGNGSQDIFWSDKSVMYCSTHEMPLYPGTGAIGERGEHNTIVNAPLRAGDGGDAIPRGVRERDPAAAARRSSRTAGDFRRLRRAHARSARQSQSGGSGLHLGDAEADGDRRAERRAAASSRCWKAATTCRACRARSPRTSPR